MSTAETWTVGKLLTWTADYLKKYGSTSPRLDAEVLLAEAKGCGRIDLYTAFTEEPTEQVRASFKEMVRRRAEGTPVAYLVGRKEFYSLSFEVNPDVLIPRPETEHLVVEAIDRAKSITGQSNARDAARLAESHAQQTPDALPQSESAPANQGERNSEQGGAGEWAPRPRPQKSFNGLRIADVGTGSGIIAISLAKSLPGAQITALDRSKPALEVARRNVEKHAVQQQVLLIESDLLSAVASERFDIVVSNPPYISEPEFAALPTTVRNFEPKGALVGGPTGTEIIERLIPQAYNCLRNGGHLLIEFSPMIADRVAQMFNRDQWSEPVIVKDLAGHARIVAVSRLGT